ncbi:M23 family metallopeptidase [Rubritalea spongiae]|uniref:M23 family metallopeptidase n=1 Tax=Rubritalea spongiae TaxID=430797 RepID=A0ABW5E0M8_9BACT
MKFFALLFAFVTASALHASTPLNLTLPTENEHIFSNTPEKFYMYTYRNFEGVDSHPWTAGKYGYVRTLRRTDEGVIATKFHEGIDIRPIKRDRYNRPLDIVNSIADGKVVYINPHGGNSNYGIYLVVEHDWGSGLFYSLYAHLASVSCKTGQTVSAGSPLGIMGYTGSGINRERSHLHLELGVMANQEFSKWHASYFSSPNHHGNYNGLNMNGLNIAELFIRNKNNPNLTITQFISKVPTYFKVTIPRRRELDLAKRYPWIRKGNHELMTPAWEISFASSGFPLAITPSNRAVVKPTVTYVTPTKSDHKYHTKGIIRGTGKQATLTSLGQRVMSLMTSSFLD